MAGSVARMTSSTPAALPPAPVLRMRDPGELLAALPYLLGFHPRESLVVLAFGGRSGRRVGLTQRVDLPPPEDAAAVCAAMAGNVLLGRPTGAAVLVVGGGAPAAGTGPPRAELVATATAALAGHGVPVRMRAWSGSTAAGAPWACYDECRCAGALPDPATTPLAATAVAAGVLVHADRAELEQLVAPVAAEALRRRERLLTRAVDAEVHGPGEPGAVGPADGVVDAALDDAAAGRLHLDDGRVVALALALADPLVRDAALVRCAAPGAESAEQLWAALTRGTPDPEAAEPAALLAACALLRGDGALAGIALDRAEQAWPGHRLTGLLRAAWQAGMAPGQVRECLRTAPLPPAVQARLRRRGSGR
ncbi:MAG: hypothetical protein QOK35_1195 [Pseudonocardiales bacterium]|nr:hypothetical protein [Pseudonocardiales bacterium]